MTTQTEFFRLCCWVQGLDTGTATGKVSDLVDLYKEVSGVTVSDYTMSNAFKTVGRHWSEEQTGKISDQSEAIKFLAKTLSETLEVLDGIGAAFGNGRSLPKATTNKLLKLANLGHPRRKQPKKTRRSKKKREWKKPIELADYETRIIKVVGENPKIDRTALCDLLGYNRYYSTGFKKLENRGLLAVDQTTGCNLYTLSPAGEAAYRQHCTETCN